MYYTDRAWWTVPDAARLLRVHTDTLYDACRDGFPHKRIGNYIRIPCEALRMRYKPQNHALDAARKRLGTYDPEQLELPLDPACLIPVRRYRNTREIIEPIGFQSQMGVY